MEKEENQNCIYTAVTIGPIYKTFSQARRSRELWGASYLFSYITHSIINKVGKGHLLLPFSPQEDQIQGKGAGFFPDRLIFEGDRRKIIGDANEEIMEDISGKSGLPVDYLKNYLRVYALTFTLPAIGVESGSNNIVIVANRLLDAVELQEKYYQEISAINWRNAIDNMNGNLFYPKAFNKEDGFLFPSLIEIATDDFSQKNRTAYNILVKDVLRKSAIGNLSQDEQDAKNEADFINSLTTSKQFESLKWSPYHKYIAVVEADGDNIGNTIGAIGERPDEVKQFSSALFDFSLEATAAITRYGGKPVYSGGDDLLFFAPIAVYTQGNEKSEIAIERTDHLKSIFALLKELDNVFEQKILENEKLKHWYEANGLLADKKPSLSFGVSISYYKFPLNESRDCAHRLLVEAKKIKDDKNKICFRLRKHSGQSFETTVDKKKVSFKHFQEVVMKIPLNKEMLSSVIHKLLPLQTLLEQIAGDKERLYQFFEQEFEIARESKKTANDEFVWNVVDYFHQLTRDFPTGNETIVTREIDKNDSNIGKLYYVLRFLKHLTDDSDE
jgi:CRISPR-associated protein Cmr2